MRVRTSIKWTAAMMPMVILCFGVTMAVKDYGLHREAINSVSPEDKVASIYARESYTTLDRLPKIYVDVVLSVGDHRFYNCSGVDVITTGGAVLNGIRTGSFVEGVSMATQQLAKNMYSSQEEELVRKTAEALMIFDLERDYSRNEVLELYVNTIYYGNGYYYVKDANNDYFDKEPEDMTGYESTLLAETPNAPSCYTSTVSQELAARRQ